MGLAGGVAIRPVLIWAKASSVDSAVSLQRVDRRPTDVANLPMTACPGPWVFVGLATGDIVYEVHDINKRN